MYLCVLASYIIGSQITGSYFTSKEFSDIASNIKNAETLYRIGLSIELVASGLTILLGGAFYALLKSVRPNLALFAVLWRTAEAIFGGIAVVMSFVALKNYLGETSVLNVADKVVLAEILSSAKMAMFYTSIIFFSVGSSLFFLLLYQSKYIPTWMSIFGIFASVLAGCLAFITLINPTLGQILVYAWAPIFAIEVITGAWLLIRGINTKDECSESNFAK